MLYSGVRSVQGFMVRHAEITLLLRLSEVLPGRNGYPDEDFYHAPENTRKFAQEEGTNDEP